MEKLTLVFFCWGLLFSTTKAQTVVDYELVFNTNTCLYEAHAHFSGTPRPTLPGIISAPILYTVVIPSSAGINTPITPTVVNPPFSSYSNSIITDAPTADPNSTFHSFAHGGGAFFNPITTPSDLVLFTFPLPPNSCGTGIRLYVNGSDPASNAPGMNGQDHSQSFQLVDIGDPNTASELYNMNLSNDAITTQDPSAAPSVTCSAAGIALLANPTISTCAMATTTYSWADPSGTVISTMENPTIPLVDPIAQAGDYSVTITDANGCSITEIINLAAVACPVTCGDCLDADCNNAYQINFDEFDPTTPSVTTLQEDGACNTVDPALTTAGDQITICTEYTATANDDIGIGVSGTTACTLNPLDNFNIIVSTDDGVTCTNETVDYTDNNFPVYTMTMATSYNICVTTTLSNDCTLDEICIAPYSFCPADCGQYPWNGN